MEADTIPNE
jgi:hypothetical protein